MSFRLKEATYKIRCREPGCTFISEFVVKENFMGVTEADVDSEAIKIAKNMAFIKHDALHGRKHQLANPEIFKTSSSYERIGGLTADSVFSQTTQAGADQGVPGRTFQRGQVIMKKHDDSASVVEVVRGSAQNAGHPGLRYRPGAMVGSAAIFHQKARPSDIVAAEDNTVVSFHDVMELSRTNPARAKELYDRALEDVFHVMHHLEESCAALAKKVSKLESLRAGPKPRATRKPAAAARKPVAARKPIAARKRTAKPAASKRRQTARARKA